MKWYPWLRPHFEKLIPSYQIGKGHHALLIQALPGMGDDSLVYFISRFLMCQRSERYKSCNRCRSCCLMQTQTHPDYYTLEPEKGKNVLGIDIIRDISEKIYKYSSLGGAKVIWLKDAAQLTEAAANSLLKVLEEPPEETWFFLSCQEAGRLLTTLRSRCLLYHLSIPDEIWSMNWLAYKVTASREERLSALRLCGGAPAAALAQLQPEIWSQRKQLSSALYSALESNDWLVLLNVLNHEQAVQRLYWLASFLLDAVKLQHGITLLGNIDAWPLLNMLSNYLSSTVIQTILNDICEIRRQLLTISGLNLELILTNLLLHIEDSIHLKAIQ